MSNVQVSLCVHLICGFKFTFLILCLQIPSDVSKIFSDDACVNIRESVSTILLDRTCFSVVVVVIIDFFHTKSSQIKLGGLSIKT